MAMTMGSLFDGAGTMPFAGELCGIETLWSSEIEKFPCAVTKKRFPRVKQLGDVTKINGAEIEPVDIITFGSPCQDLSIAGQRAGLKGERSGLFMEAVRIIKEMRNATRNGANEPVRPRYAVWENVPGAYSSNGGDDFRAVLEELCRVADDEVSIPRPPQGRWGGLVPLWETDIQSLGARWMRSIGECPKDVEGSGLSQILEDDVPLKYYLSEKACLGILRRSEKRGLPLDPRLKAALQMQACMQSVTGRQQARDFTTR